MTRTDPHSKWLQERQAQEKTRREEEQEVFEEGLRLAGEIPVSRPLVMRKAPSAAEWANAIGEAARKSRQRTPVHMDEQGYLFTGTSGAAALLLGDDPLEGRDWDSSRPFFDSIRGILGSAPIAVGVGLAPASLWRQRSKIPPAIHLYARLLTHPGNGPQQVELQLEHRVDGSWMSVGFLPGTAIGEEQRATIVFDLNLMLKSHRPSACAMACSIFSNQEHETHPIRPRDKYQRAEQPSPLVLQWSQVDRPVIYTQAGLRF